MGLPHFKLSGAEEALASIAAGAEAANLPVWRDELYLEAHRGTFTNKALLKKYNRRLEFLYREAEILASWAWVRIAVFSAAYVAAYVLLRNLYLYIFIPALH